MTPSTSASHLTAAKLASDDFEVTGPVLPLLRFTRSDDSPEAANAQVLSGTLTVHYAGFDRDMMSFVFARKYLISAHAIGRCILAVSFGEMADASAPRSATFTLMRLETPEPDSATIGQRLSLPGMSRAAVSVERIEFDYMASSAKPGSELRVELLVGTPT